MTVRSLAVSLVVLSVIVAQAADWPQFRGPNASGLAQGTGSVPLDVGPDKHVVWKTALPPGHSSPVIVGDRVYVTGVKDEKLLTIALDRTTGNPLWMSEAPHEKLESFHPVGNCAQSTPAADSERVVSFFGSCGLYCFDRNGQLVWKLPMGPFKNDFGAASSPIIDGDRVILNQDHDTDSFLMAVDKRSGEVLWKTDRSEFPRNFATPVIWDVAGRKQIVVPATLRIVGYDYDSGKEVWTVPGVARIINMTPVVGPDGTLFVPCWAPGGDENDRITAQPFDELIAGDKNHNGTLEIDEVPDGQIKTRFSQIDRDKSEHITRDEYESMRRIFEEANNVLLAIKPGGQGDISSTHVKWKFNRGLPYCPSPVLADGWLFMVKEGGIVTSLEAATGTIGRQDRVSATGGYYSSPVYGNGKVFLLSQRGVLTVISAQAQWKQLAKADFGEDAYATPAIVDGRLYLRTAGFLYCLGQTQLAANLAAEPE